MNDLIKVWVLVSFYDETGLHKAGTVAYVPEEEFNEKYMKKIDSPTPGSSSLEDLTDVAVSGVDDGEVLVYDSASQKWVNGIVGGGSEIDNIQLTDDDQVDSMEIDGNNYYFSTVGQVGINSDGKVTSVVLNDTEQEFTNIDNVEVDSEYCTKSFNLNGDTVSFVSIENISTAGPNGEVDAMDINGTSYSFATGGGGIEVSQASADYIVEEVSDGTDYWTVAHQLQDLEDVDLDGQGNVLVYDGGHWTNGKPVFSQTIVELRSSSQDKISEIPANTTATFDCYRCDFTNARLLNGEPILFYDKNDNIYYYVAYFDGNGKMTLLRQNNRCYEVTVASADSDGKWQTVNVLRVQ